MNGAQLCPLSRDEAVRTKPCRVTATMVVPAVRAKSKGGLRPKPSPNTGGFIV
jgi:hypothetical protein